MTIPCGNSIEDIEDIISPTDISPKEKYKFLEVDSTYTRRRKKHELILPELTVYSSIIPGTQTIYIKTWGCSHNNSDSEYMAGQLSSYGYNLTDDKYIADLWLLNSCTVKGPAEDHFRNQIEHGLQLGKYIVLSGCVPQGAPKTNFIQGISIIGTHQVDRVVEVVGETLKGNTVRLMGQKKRAGRKLGGASLFLPKIRKNPLIEIIAISTGCLNQCTYCKTKHARGDLGSYEPNEILRRAEQAFNEGVRELWLTSEDTGAYGRDIKTNLPELLRKLLKIIPNGCRMRIGMTNPPYILEYLEEMSEILQDPKVYSFLHVPVQSGSNQVLSDMKREYTKEDFELIIDFLKTKDPKINITTDIICGFPSEAEEDFKDTLDLCRKYRFSSLFINQFFPRPGTPAANMIQIPKKEVKRRTKILSEFFQSYKPYHKNINQIQDILVTEIANDRKHYVGHNRYYEQVLIPMKKEYMGKMIKVKIIDASKYSMIGMPLDDIAPYMILSSILKLFFESVQNYRSNKKYFITFFILLCIIFISFLWKCMDNK